MINLGKLEEVYDLRKVWPHEALDFTPWLASDDNIGSLSDAIGIDIAIDEEESPVGDFSVDIFAREVDTGRKVIIENQLESTNHDHLGKLITYASGKSADIIVWLVKHAREEHKAAIEWLNNHTDDKVAFFLCEIKLYKIGDSSLAVKFEVVERPNDWAKDVKKADATSAVQQCRYDYWVAFQDYAFQSAEFAREFNRRKPTYDHWLDFSIGSSICHMAVTQQHKRQALAVECYISNDKELFRSLFGHRAEIEAESGLKFDWRELPLRKASRILIEKGFELTNTNQWDSQFEWVVDVMLRMKKTFKKYI
ncbi:MAG: DUF4268 domain-containing protein [Kiritimatiellae bacterium]|nr:DUF4268 domain-containing protein [Kiritimatiellia bacterium]